MIGAGGIEQVIEIELDAAAKAGLDVSINEVKALIAACKELDPSLA